MVSFPATSGFLDRLDADSDAVRLDAILPDVLRRYGITPTSGRESATASMPNRTLPVGVWLPNAGFHSVLVSDR